MNRRQWLLFSAGSALLVGCAPADRQQPRDGALPLKDGEVALNGWLKLSADNTVTVVLGKSEMGQGAHTALMMLVAEELDAAWPSLRAEQSPVDRLYGNVIGLAEGVPFRPDDEGALAGSFRWFMERTMRQMGFMMTGGSSSVRDLWLPMRQAAALTRAAIVSAVAKQWAVEPAAVQVASSVLSAADGRAMSFGQAVALLRNPPAGWQPPSTAPLKEPAQFKLIGKPMPRHDALARVEGRVPFGIDILRPGMLYAAVRLCPVIGGRVSTFDAAEAKAMAGVQAVVSFAPPEAEHSGTGGVAVVADNWHRANVALAAVKVQWSEGAASAVDNGTVAAALKTALDADDGFNFWKKGDVAAAMASASTKLQAEYSAPYLAHATLEPMNTTVELAADGKSATVWAPTQVPGFARRAAAQALGMEEKAVKLETTQLGGGFGRRLESDFVHVACAVAAQLPPGRAVQVLWSRSEDMQHDFYRPAAASRFEAGLDAQGRVNAWRNATAAQDIVPQFLPRNAGMPAAGPDKTGSEGAFDVAYEFPNVRVSHTGVELPVPVGFWRAVGHSHQAFFKEGFLDECATAAKADARAFRAALLQNHPRQRAVLELAALKSGWGDKPAAAPDGAPVARGIALHESFGSVVAQVAEVSVVGSGAERVIRVHRVVCAIDCGLPVNPNGIAQQMESSVLFALSAALYSQIEFKGGRVQQNNFHDYPLLRIDAAPVIETHIVPSTAPPQGVGEPGVPPLAPAVAAAVFALTGQRLRSLPFKFQS